jgi:hypothetical protein
MLRRRPHLALAAVLAVFVSPAAAGEREKPRSSAAREELEAVEAHIARAVDRVSLPHAARLLGRVESARAYRLPGYGIVLVLTPHAARGGPDLRPARRRASNRGGKSRPVAGARGVAEPATKSDRDLRAAGARPAAGTEAARRAAEEEMERIVQDMRVRVAPSEVHVEAGRRRSAGAAVGAGPPRAPRPRPPPWKFWFETARRRKRPGR